MECRLRNESGTYVWSFAGEEFPEPDARQPPQRTRSCAREEQGPPILFTSMKRTRRSRRRLNGQFHGLLTDQKPRHGDAVQRPVRNAPALLSRVERSLLFRRRSQGHFSRSSRAASGGSDGLGEFVAYSCVLENRTVFEERSRSARCFSLVISERLD